MLATALPRSVRWLVEEAGRPPAFTPDGKLRPGLRVLQPEDDTLLMSDTDDAEVIASKRSALSENGEALYVTDGLPSTLEG